MITVSHTCPISDSHSCGQHFYTTGCQSSNTTC